MSPYIIHVTNRQKALPAAVPRLRRTARHVLADRAAPNAQVSIVLVDDAAIAPLKLQYYGYAEATDVLSFDLADEPDEPHPHEPDAPELDLEIIINAQRALRIATERGHDPHAELHLYLVHGLLHQLGFDDQTPAQARAMHAHEDRLLTELGFGPVYASAKHNDQR